MKILEYLKGKKTYLCALAIAIIVFLQQIGVIDEETMKTLLTLFGAGGIAALRAGIKKSE